MKRSSGSNPVSDARNLSEKDVPAIVEQIPAEGTIFSLFRRDLHRHQSAFYAAQESRRQRRVAAVAGG